MKQNFKGRKELILVLLEKEIDGEVFKTKFEFDDEHTKLVKEILKCLKGKTVDVPIGDEANGVIPISILDWFPIVCSKVKFDTSGGSYITFFNPSIMALTLRALLELKLPSIDAFAGNITISRDVINCDDAFRYTLAHEMQHAINALNFAYPALTNWDGFLLNTIQIKEVRTSPDFNPTIDRLTKLDRIQDEVSIEEELKTLEKTFDSPINTWYEGFKIFVNERCPKNP